MNVVGLTAAVVSKEERAFFDYSVVAGNTKDELVVRENRRCELSVNNPASVQRSFAYFIDMARRSISESLPEASLFFFSGSNEGLDESGTKMILKALKKDMKRLAPEYVPDLFQGYQGMSSYVLLKHIEFCHATIAKTLAIQNDKNINLSNLDFSDEHVQYEKNDIASLNGIMKTEEGDAEDGQQAASRLADAFLDKHNLTRYPRLKFVRILDPIENLQRLSGIPDLRAAFGKRMRQRLGIKGNLALKFRNDPPAPPLTDPLAAVMADALDKQTGNKPGIVLAKILS